MALRPHLRRLGLAGALAFGLSACGGPDITGYGQNPETVGYRDGLTNGDNPDLSDELVPPDEVSGGQSGERGTVKISEVMWSGSVTNEGTWDPSDVFVELRNESLRPMNLSGWLLHFRGGVVKELRLPETDRVVQVGEHVFVAAKSPDDGSCFSGATWVVPELEFSPQDNFSVTLRDPDERLIEGAGDYGHRPFAGGYDLVVSRSMEKAELMFGGRGNHPQSWHHYTRAVVEIPNNTNVVPECRERTLASPGKPNSPDYAGAFAAGALD